MPIRSIKNQYRGINPHLHSFWQAEREWGNFHNPYINQLIIALRPILVPIGYTVKFEDAIQIRRVSELEDDELKRHESDMTIYDVTPSRYMQQRERTPHLTGLVMPKIEFLPEKASLKKPYQAVAIYKRQQEQRPIVWIELLSPSNKLGGQDRRDYIDKRQDIIDSGIIFVEIDFLHEYRPAFENLPDYSSKQRNSHPYRIVLIEPEVEGRVSINEFDADDPIPTVNIPLSGAEVLAFDFDKPYQKQFEEMVYGLEQVDYAQLPLRFNRYSEADQLRIVNRMLTILEAVQQGQDLEQAPLPLLPAPTTLEEGLKQLESRRKT